MGDANVLIPVHVFTPVDDIFPRMFTVSLVASPMYMFGDVILVDAPANPTEPVHVLPPVHVFVEDKRFIPPGDET